MTTIRASTTTAIGLPIEGGAARPENLLRRQRSERRSGRLYSKVQCGFTLFELILVIVLVAIFAGILLGRFLIYQEMAEKASMELTAGTIRSAINLQAAGLVSRGRASDITKLATVNPFKWLTEKQKNYAGEYYDPKNVPPGSWYYDLRNKEVVYLVYRGAHFAPNRQGEKLVRFKVAVVYNDALAGDTDLSRRDLGGIAFREVEPYVWDFN